MSKVSVLLYGFSYDINFNSNYRIITKEIPNFNLNRNCNIHFQNAYYAFNSFNIPSLISHML